APRGPVVRHGVVGVSELNLQCSELPGADHLRRIELGLPQVAEVFEMPAAAPGSHQRVHHVPVQEVEHPALTPQKRDPQIPQKTQIEDESRWSLLISVSSAESVDHTHCLCHSTCLASPSSMPVVGVHPTCRNSFLTSAPVGSRSPLPDGCPSPIPFFPMIRPSCRITSTTVTSSPPPRLNTSPGIAAVARTVASTQSAKYVLPRTWSPSPVNVIGFSRRIALMNR